MKKAILVVSFGTTDHGQLQGTMIQIENKMKKEFPDCEVRRAFTSRMILAKIAERDGVKIDNEQEALARLQAAGYKEIFVQPLHLIPDVAYQTVKEKVVNYVHATNKVFDRITIGRPLLYYMGQQGRVDDCLIAIKAIENQLPRLGRQEAVVLINYGAIDPLHAAYVDLKMKLEKRKLHNVFIGTITGVGSLDKMIEKLQNSKINKVTVMPFELVINGNNNMEVVGGDQDTSAKAQFLKAGFEVDVYTHGLCENVAIQDIYVQHLKDAIAPSTTHT